MSTAVVRPKVGEYIDIPSEHLKLKVTHVSEALECVETDDVRCLFDYQNDTWFLSKVQPGQVWVTGSVSFKIVDWDFVGKQWEIRYTSEPFMETQHTEALIISCCTLVSTEGPAAIAKDFPHACHSCGSKAYVGFNSVDCSNNRCHHYAR